MGQTSNLSSYIKTRMRGSESVPYVAHPFAISTPGTIHEIVVGPSATADAEDRVRVMLASRSDSCGRQTVEDPLSRVTAEDLVRGGMPSVGIGSFRPP
jgi:hypothetical protein